MTGKSAMLMYRERKGGVVNTGFHIHMSGFTGSLEARNYSPATLTSYTRSLARFIRHLERKGFARLQDVELEDLEEYRLELIRQKLNLSTVDLYLRGVKDFFNYLEGKGFLFMNPARKLKSPRPDRKIRFVPSPEEIEALVRVINTATPAGARDRAMVETAYSTGTRSMELLGLDIRNVDFESAALRVFGKGRKERVTPLGRIALVWIKTYLDGARQQLLAGQTDLPALWLDQYGRRLAKGAFGARLSWYSQQAGLRRISVHTIRRACATHMLAGGAGPAQIQALLGHASTKYLSQYLAVTLTEMKKTHRESRVGQ